MRLFILFLSLFFAAFTYAHADKVDHQVTFKGFWVSERSKLNLGVCESYPAVDACKSDYAIALAELESVYTTRQKEAYCNHARQVGSLDEFGDTPRPQLPDVQYFTEKFKRAKLFLEVMANGGFQGVPYPTPDSAYKAVPQIDDVLVWLEGYQGDAVYKVSQEPLYEGKNGDTLFRVSLSGRENSPLQVTGHLVLSTPVDFRLPHYFELENCSPSLSLVGMLARNKRNPKAYYLDYLARDTSRTRDIASLRAVLKREGRDLASFPNCELVAKVVPSVDCYNRFDRPDCYDRTFGQCHWDVKRKQCYGSNYEPW